MIGAICKPCLHCDSNALGSASWLAQRCAHDQGYGNELLAAGIDFLDAIIVASEGERDPRWVHASGLPKNLASGCLCYGAPCFTRN